MYRTSVCRRRRYLRLAALDKAMREQGVANMESKAGEEAGSAWTRVGRLGSEEAEDGDEGDAQALAAGVPTAGAGVSAAGGRGR